MKLEEPKPEEKVNLSIAHAFKNKAREEKTISIVVGAIKLRNVARMVLWSGFSLHPFTEFN